MKLILLFILFGCTFRNDLERLETTLYELDTIYIEDDLDELHVLLDISNNDYSDSITLESLVIYEQKKLYIFKDPSDYLKKQIKQLNNYYYEINNYIIYMSEYDQYLINIINSYLNKT